MPREIFDIFLSSTSQDLAPYREKVREMVERLRGGTIRMETFGAQPGKPMKTCQEEVMSCDALIVIVGHRYGWIPSVKDGGDGKKNITWWEVHWALEAKKPVYSFLVDPAASWTQQREQDLLLNAKTEANFVSVGRAVKSLYEFRKFLEANTTREFFTSPDDLASRVAGSLHPWLLQQAVNSVKSNDQQVGGIHAKLPEDQRISFKVNISTHEFLGWQEQVHLPSAITLLENADRKIKIGIIAGKADTNHPALAHANIQHIDVRRKKSSSSPDDYTTGLAGLLVGTQAGLPNGAIPNAELVIIQALSKDFATTMAEVDAAVEMAIFDGVNVLCMTLGSPENTKGAERVYQRAAKAGMITVCAAGNEPASKIYPAAYPECISVTAVDSLNKFAFFSPTDSWVTTAAPGVDIPVPSQKNNFAHMSGTTSSCAITTIVVASMLKINPKLNVQGVKQILTSTGTAIINPNGAGVTLINALNCILEAQNQIRKKTKNNARKKAR
jgi:hypothetical protein